MAGAVAAAVPSHEGALAATRAERTVVTRGAPDVDADPVAPGWRPLLRTPGASPCSRSDGFRLAPSLAFAVRSD